MAVLAVRRAIVRVLNRSASAAVNLAPLATYNVPPVVHMCFNKPRFLQYSCTGDELLTSHTYQCSPFPHNHIRMPYHASYPTQDRSVNALLDTECFVFQNNSSRFRMTFQVCCN